MFQLTLTPDKSPISAAVPVVWSRDRCSKRECWKKWNSIQPFSGSLM